MNLVSIEEHPAFAAVKTKDPTYRGTYSAVRKLRSKYQKQIVVRNTSGEM